MKNTKTIPLWIAVNKNNFIGIHAAQPVRNDETGKWESKRPFCNADLQKRVTEMVKGVQLTWSNEPEFIEIEVTSSFAE